MCDADVTQLFHVDYTENGENLALSLCLASTCDFSLFAVDVGGDFLHLFSKSGVGAHRALHLVQSCLLYTSDAADD